MLVHYCAVGNRRLRILNGNQKGNSLQDIQDFDPQEYRNQPDAAILDNRTGDFYTSRDRQWKVAGNVGLHWVYSLGTKKQLVEKAREY